MPFIHARIESAQYSRRPIGRQRPLEKFLVSVTRFLHLGPFRHVHKPSTSTQTHAGPRKGPGIGCPVRKIIYYSAGV